MNLSGVHYFLLISMIYEISALIVSFFNFFFFNTTTFHDRVLISVSVGLYPHQLRGHDRQSHRFSHDFKPDSTAQLKKHS
jgi:hypothetical protein